MRIEGEFYTIEYTDSLASPIQWRPWPLPGGGLFATTPCSTAQVPLSASGQRYFRVTQGRVPASYMPQLHIELAPNSQLRISWPTTFTGFTLQYTTSLTNPVWNNVGRPVTIIGGEYVVFDDIGNTPKYYRLIR